MNYASYIMFVLISFVLKILPRKISLFIGRLIGRFLYYVVPIRKKVAKKNINSNFKNLSIKERKKILKDTYIHYGMVLVDFMRISSNNVKSINKLFSIDDESKKILDKNRGSIMVTGHFGNWEYFAPFLSLNNFKFCIIAQVIKNKFLNNYFYKNRKFDNVKIIFKNEGISKMINALNENYFLGLAADQNAGNSGIKVDFLNMNVSFPKGPAIFHQKTKKNILFTYLIMDENYNYKFKAKILPIEELNLTNDDYIKNVTSLYSKYLEKIIIKNPSQYFWFHKIQQKSYYS